MPKTGSHSNLAHRFYVLRRQRALTLDACASHTGLTKSYLSKVERGLSTPSIATALKLARVFDVPLGTLLGESPHDELVCVVRANERNPLERRGTRAGYYYEAIAARRAIKAMEPFVMRPPLARSSEDILSEHEGEELIFVLKGRIEITFPDRRVELTPGDSIYFDSRFPHRSRSLDRTRAEALVVVADKHPPSRRQPLSKTRRVAKARHPSRKRK